MIIGEHCSIDREKVKDERVEERQTERQTDRQRTSWMQADFTID